MKKIIISIFSIIIFASASQSVYAQNSEDKPNPPGYCFEILNVSAFNEYVVIFQGQIESNIRRVQRGDCIAFTYNAEPKLHAIKKELFDKDDMQANLNNPSLITSAFTFNHPLKEEPYQFPDSVQLIRDTFSISSLDESGLVIEGESVEYTYFEGEPEIREYEEGQLTRPDAIRDSFNILNYWWAILATILVGFFILVFKFKKNNIQKPTSSKKRTTISKPNKKHTNTSSRIKQTK